MYYLILSWSQCIDKLADSIESDDNTCPVCYDKLSEYDSLEDILINMKRCYCLHKIGRNTIDEMKTIDRANAIKSIIESVDDEIDNYVIERLQDPFDE